jgi:hypothetical protein
MFSTSGCFSRAINSDVIAIVGGVHRQLTVIADVSKLSLKKFCSKMFPFSAECVEQVRRKSKCLRFLLSWRQPGKPVRNRLADGGLERSAGNNFQTIEIDQQS